jgi:chemotaxis protein CheX
MRLDFVKQFIHSTSQVFEELLGNGISVKRVAMKANPMAGQEVMVVIGVAGEAQGRVILDMDLFTAVHLAAHMIGEPPPGMTPLVRSSIAELASMAIGRAISCINNSGTKLSMTPPTIITGSNLVSDDLLLETLVAPIVTEYGEVRVNVTLQDLN